ncbi:hypothetical protein ACMFMG_004766 [Clarireedia jacksonii]
MGPYKAIFAANDSAPDQVIIGKVLESQGGGQFLTSMGLRPGVVLPSGTITSSQKTKGLLNGSSGTI